MLQMKNYRYNCVDESILLPWLKKNLFAVLHRGIPYGVPANMLTLISIIIMWTTFFFFVNLEEVAGHDILLAVVAIFLYILFDHFDGLQAKATRSSSPLGEILDHFSDVFNGAIVFYLCFRVLQVDLDWLFLTVLWFNYMVFAVTYVEQNVRKELYFGKIGSLEGLVLILLIMVSCIPVDGRNLWHASFLDGVPAYLALFLLFSTGCLYTLAGSFKRMASIPGNFIHFFCAGSLLFLLCIYYRFSWEIPFLVLTVFSGDFILKAMQSYLFDEASQSSDKIIYLLLPAVLVSEFTSFEVEPLFMVYGIIVGIKLIWLSFIIFSRLKSHWIWWNP